MVLQRLVDILRTKIAFTTKNKYSKLSLIKRYLHNSKIKINQIYSVVMSFLKLNNSMEQQKNVENINTNFVF